MNELSTLLETVERTLGRPLATVSGGNSANLTWALEGGISGRISQLRIGEGILLGTEPLRELPLPGLRTDGFRLVGEVIEVSEKPVTPWGFIAQAPFGRRISASGRSTLVQAIVAIGEQDADFASLIAPEGIRLLGMSSDHLILDCGERPLTVGDEVSFGLRYPALLRAATSPYVAMCVVG